MSFRLRESKQLVPYSYFTYLYFLVYLFQLKQTQLLDHFTFRREQTSTLQTTMIPIFLLSLTYGFGWWLYWRWPCTLFVWVCGLWTPEKIVLFIDWRNRKWKANSGIMLFWPSFLLVRLAPRIIFSKCGLQQNCLQSTSIRDSWYKQVESSL